MGAVEMRSKYLRVVGVEVRILLVVEYLVRVDYFTSLKQL